MANVQKTCVRRARIPTEPPFCTPPLVVGGQAPIKQSRFGSLITRYLEEQRRPDPLDCEKILSSDNKLIKLSEKKRDREERGGGGGEREKGEREREKKGQRERKRERNCIHDLTETDEG